ncbi:hypothetical protein CYLTODRAFT_487433 [Cylindrobasidium torrendii FP15055 ss-10]|uniref:Uncharacterized protein n=1 Tax=Cylindrobasidium torrendii FP15055 ss-10 TaxID=1314674 RepID=A0A0D7BL98_9AGAR|nr:hypothetical protein CYLTODRAFT_487433 [Cylindrobasidium torrendii FP15055 ss-10]
MASRNDQDPLVQRERSPSTKIANSKRKIASLSDSDDEEEAGSVQFEIDNIFPSLCEAEERALTDNLEEPKNYLIHEAAIVKLIRRIVHLETVAVRNVARTFKNRVEYQKQMKDIEWDHRKEIMGMYHEQQKYIDELEEIMTYHNIALPDRPVEKK